MSSEYDTQRNQHPVGHHQFPNPEMVEYARLQELEHFFARDRTLGWLRSNIAIPLRYQFDEDFDEDAYFEAMREQYVETDPAQTGGSHD